VERWRSHRSHPTVDQAINGGYPWLEIECDVDLAALPHVSTTFVHDLASRLVCQKCRKVGKRPAVTLLQLAPRQRHDQRGAQLRSNSLSRNEVGKRRCVPAAPWRTTCRSGAGLRPIVYHLHPRERGRQLWRSRLSVTAFPTNAISVTPAKEFIDHALAGRTERDERHFLAACRTKRKTRRDAL
jgi:hypothetical protein